MMNVSVKCDPTTILACVITDDKKHKSLSSQQFLWSGKIGAKHRKRVLFQSDVILVKLGILGKISCSNNFSL